ncbi:tyrosine-type recombinase/integrase [Gryllotalpicola sp.]|uniref:tyrosine-type recombinase/integrase n=1 Tax=Gryllotalpicola sp. TaxID=1932787 RepID=UPI002629560B|nr:tyrosine-type recombinase/integrase [Gryllotalpicola sp.]
MARGQGEGSIFKRADGLWVGRIELPGRDGERRRKQKASRDKAVIVKWLADQRQQLGQRGDLPTSSPLAKDWLPYWLEKIAAPRVRPNTWQHYEHSIRLYAIPSLGSTRMDRITTAHLRRMAENITTKNLSPTTALHAHRAMAKALEDATREGVVGRNVAKLMDAPKRAATDALALTVEEAVAVIGEVVPALEAEEYDPLPALWATYLLTAARRGEILGLELDRVSDFLDLSWQMQRIKPGVPVPDDYERRSVKGGLWLVRPKTSSGWRAIPLVEPLKTLLKQHIERSAPNPYGLLFVDERGEPLDPNVTTNLWRQWRDARELTKAKLHGLRHTTIDLLYEAGVPEDIIEEIAGHSQRSVTRGYKTPTKMARRTEAMKALSALLTKK